MDDATAGRRPDLIHAVFRARAATRPDSVALIQGRRRVTYRSLDESSDAVASLLHARGVGPGQTVPVLLASSVELVVALLAVLKCGAAYAALDAAWPAARQRAVVRQVNARTVIVGSPEVFPDGLVLPGAPVPPGGPAPVPDADITGADPAMVFFTSGTTGRPKAVVSPHRATLRLFDDCPFARFDTSTVMPQAAAVPWDAFALELWGPLLNGGTCVLLDDHPFGPRGLRQVIRRHGVDTVFLTTSLFHLVVDEDVAAFTGLRTVIAGGEELRPDQCARFLAVHPGIRLVNGYGPVESTVFALTHDVTAQELHGPVPLGRPVPHTQVVVVDDGRICDPDEVGELCIAGDGLAVEYLGDPAETAARFVTLTLAGSPVRLYRTGDRGSRRADGVYLFAGRADRQVKVRGHRVEPAAVERAADLVAGVRRSAAVLLPGAGGGYESMGLVYRAEPAAGATPHTVLAALRAELPAYSVPARVVEVAAFPLTPTGKLDTAALRELLRQAPSAVGGQASGVVARAFAEVLELTAVDPHTSLFELGGTSLSAIRICHRLGAQLGRPIPVSRLMRAQTVAALERWLTEPLPAAAPDPADDPPPAADRDSVPLSAMQGGFLLGNLDPEFDLAALCPMIWEIDGPVDVAALAAAVADVHHRHGYLSARYDLTAGALATPGDRGSDFQLIKVANEAAARRLLYEALSRPLVLADAEVWRVVLVQTSSRRSLLGIVVHHIAFDGWSEHVLARDLGTAYAARVDGCAPRFAYPVPGLADADRLQRQLLQAADLAEQARFWRAELAGVPALAWPDERTGGPVVAEIALSPSHLAGIDRAGRLPALLDVVGDSVEQATGQQDFAIGLPVTRRASAATEHLVACLIDTVSVRRRPGTATSATVAAVLQHADLPFAEVARMSPRVGGGRNPVYQVMAVLQDSPEPQLLLPGSQVRLSHDAEAHRPLSELIIEFFPGAHSRPRLRIMRDPDRVGHATMAAVVAGLTARLDTLARAS